MDCPSLEIIVRNAERKWGLFPLDGGDIRFIPGLDGTYSVTGWTADGSSVYARKGNNRTDSVQMYKVSISSGKVETWKSFGPNQQSGLMAVGTPRFSRDGSGYAYIYIQDVAQAYVMRGLK